MAPKIPIDAVLHNKSDQGKSLPVYRIDETDFELNIQEMTLQETGNSRNKIPFAAMNDHGTYYSFRFLKANQSMSYLAVDDAILVTVPQMTTLDPEGMAKKYGLSIKEVLGKTDFEIMVDQQALSARESGILPVINIAGDLFIIDVANHELTLVEDVSVKIKLDTLSGGNDGEQYEFFYDTLAKQAWSVPDGLLKVPENIKSIRMPEELQLDPVRYARDHHLNCFALLKIYPPKKILEAEIVPLDQTLLPEIVRNNRRSYTSTEHDELPIKGIKL